MYAQQTTHTPLENGPVPIRAKATPAADAMDTDRISIHFGNTGDLFLSLSPAEAETLRVALGGALNDLAATYVGPEGEHRG